MGSQISTSVTIIDSLYGFQAVSLTAFDTSSAPSIAAGSKVEIAGGFFSFSADESINATSWSAISTGDTAYILLTPAGTAGTQTVTASWTDTEPEWSDAKQGYYASAGSNIRAIGGCNKTEATEYSNKWLYNKREARLGSRVPMNGTVSPGSTYTILAGVYYYRMTNTNTSYLEVKDSDGTWEIIDMVNGDTAGGLVISDGSNVIFDNTSGTTLTYKLMKIAEY